MVSMLVYSNKKWILPTYFTKEGSPWCYMNKFIQQANHTSLYLTCNGSVFSTQSNSLYNNKITSEGHFHLVLALWTAQEQIQIEKHKFNQSLQWIFRVPRAQLLFWSQKQICKKQTALILIFQLRAQKQLRESQVNPSSSPQTGQNADTHEKLGELDIVRKFFPFVLSSETIVSACQKQIKSRTAG